MALTQVFTAGSAVTATKLNESSVPVVTSVGDITAPYVGQIVFNTTDTRLYRCTNAAIPTWSAFTSGPIVSVTNSVNQSITNNSYVAANFDTELVDTDGTHSTVSNTDRLTIVKAGLYMVMPKTHFIANATGQRACRLTLNGSVVAGSVTVANNNGTQGVSVLGPTQFLQLVAGDILRMEVWQNSGAALSTEAGSPLFSAVWQRD